MPLHKMGHVSGVIGPGNGVLQNNGAEQVTAPWLLLTLADGPIGIQ